MFLCKDCQQKTGCIRLELSSSYGMCEVCKHWTDGYDCNGYGGTVTKADPKMLCEAGVTYSHEPLKGWLMFVYGWSHISTGQRGLDKIWVRCRADGNTLLAHWNGKLNGLWQYKEI
jgi:hypothetical protein